MGNSPSDLESDVDSLSSFDGGGGKKKVGKNNGGGGGKDTARLRSALGQQQKPQQQEYVLRGRQPTQKGRPDVRSPAPAKLSKSRERKGRGRSNQRGNHFVQDNNAAEAAAHDGVETVDSWKRKWSCGEDAKEVCLEKHKQKGCAEEENIRKCTKRKKRHEESIQAIKEATEYDRVVDAASLDNLRENLGKINEFLSETVENQNTRQTDASQKLVFANNFCLFGTKVSKDANTRFEVVKMLVRALDVLNMKVLTSMLNDPHTAFSEWQKLAHTSMKVRVNALLLTLGVMLPPDEQKTLNELQEADHGMIADAARKMVAEWKTAPDQDRYIARVRNNALYAQTALLARDLWVACNERVNEPPLSALWQSVDELIAMPVEVEPSRPPAPPLASFADQRMMHQIFGSMRANRLVQRSRSRQGRSRGRSQSRSQRRSRSLRRSYGAPYSSARLRGSQENQAVQTMDGLLRQLSPRSLRSSPSSGRRNPTVRRSRSGTRSRSAGRNTGARTGARSGKKSRSSAKSSAKSSARRPRR